MVGYCDTDCTVKKVFELEQNMQTIKQQLFKIGY